MRTNRTYFNFLCYYSACLDISSFYSLPCISKRRMQSMNWSLFIPAGLAEGGKNIEQQWQQRRRQWMERIKNFLKSLEEVLTTPIIALFYIWKKSEMRAAGECKESVYSQAWRWAVSAELRERMSDSIQEASLRRVRRFGRTRGKQGKSISATATE